MSEAFVPSDAVREALRDGRPVVALETSVLAQGLPYPRNVEAMDVMTGAIRARGAEPAWVFVKPGAIQVGASEADLTNLATNGNAEKVARRDLPMVIASGHLGEELTPFLLSCLAEKTGGASLEANLALLESNAALAADIAVALTA